MENNNIIIIIIEQDITFKYLYQSQRMSKFKVHGEQVDLTSTKK